MTVTLNIRFKTRLYSIILLTTFRLLSSLPWAPTHTPAALTVAQREHAVVPQ